MRAPHQLLIALPLCAGVVTLTAGLVDATATPQEARGQQQEVDDDYDEFFDGLGYYDDDEEEVPQDPFPKDRVETSRDIFGRPLDLRHASPAGRLEGAWTLVGVDVRGFPELGRDGEGMLLVGRDHVAFELHLMWDGPDTEGLADVHQSFIGEYSLRPDGTLQVYTIIGSFLDEVTEELEWESAGYPREYTAKESDGFLRLTYGLGNSLTFTRRAGARTPDRDPFGRAIRREVTSRDIFGRPVDLGRRPGEGRGLEDDPRKQSDPVPERNSPPPRPVNNDPFDRGDDPRFDDGDQ